MPDSRIVPSPIIPTALEPALACEEQNVLILKPSSLGDVVHTLPAVAMLKRHRPGWKLRWLVNPAFAPLLAGNPCLESGARGVIPFPRAEFRGIRGFPRFLQWLRALRAANHNFNGVIDFQGLFRSAFIGKALRPEWIAGLGDAREGANLLYNLRVPVSRREHSVRRYLRLAGALCDQPELANTPGEELPFPLPNGEPPPDFPIDAPFLVLHPFARGEGKSLSPQQTGELCRRLAPWRIVIAGQCDPETARALDLPLSALSLLNQTSMPQLLWLLRQAHFTISVDSGPMHIAAALGPRVLGIHTWSNPAQVGPLHPGAWVWKAGELLSAAACQDPRYLCPPGTGTPDPRELRQIAEFTLNLLE